MQTCGASLTVPGTDLSLDVIRHGHWGRPVLVFPSEGGTAHDPVRHGLVEAVRPLVDAGRVSLFCVDSADDHTWSDTSVDTQERARRNEVYTRWVTDAVVPWIGEQVGPGAAGLVATGVSLGAYHAVHLTLTRPDLAPLAIGLSGSYDVTAWNGWGEHGEATHRANPMSYVPAWYGDHLDWVRAHAAVLLVVGQGPFEVSPTRALPSTRELAAALQAQQIPCELDVWGHDSAHDWPWWQRQLAHHLPRFC